MYSKDLPFIDSISSAVNCGKRDLRLPSALLFSETIVLTSSGKSPSLLKIGCAYNSSCKQEKFMNLCQMRRKSNFTCCFYWCLHKPTQYQLLSRKTNEIDEVWGKQKQGAWNNRDMYLIINYFIWLFSWKRPFSRNGS